MNNPILIKPLVSEKSNLLSEKKNQYSFIVDKNANKISIKKAVETYYNTKVDSVNTTIIPGKRKSKYTKSGFLNGKTSSYKKAIVTLVKDSTLDLYSDI